MECRVNTPACMGLEGWSQKEGFEREMFAISVSLLQCVEDFSRFAGVWVARTQR